MEQETKQKKQENIVAGVVGAFLGTLLGVLCTVVIGQLGYVASVSGLVMAVGALKGYELLGGTLSKKGAVISSALVLVMTWLAHRLSCAVALASALDAGVFECFQSIPGLLDTGMLDGAAYWGDLVMLYLFTLLGAVPTIIAGLRSAGMPDLPQGTAASSAPREGEGLRAEFYPGSTAQMRPLRVSATAAMFVGLAAAFALIFAGVASENSIALILASLGCIAGAVVMMVIIFPSIRLCKDAMTMMVQAGGALWRVSFNALNIADTYRFTKKNGAVRTLRWDLLDPEEQERAKASVLRAIGVLTSGQVMPGSALSMAVMPLTGLRIDRETKWGWQGVYTDRNGRETKLTIPKAYPGFAPGPGFEPVREPVPSRWSLLGVSVALTVVFALLGGMAGRIIEGPAPGDPVSRNSAPVPSAPAQTAKPSAPNLPQVDYQSMFHVGEELGYTYTAVGYIVPPEGMPGAGPGVYADVHVPYSDSPEYLDGGHTIRSSAHGIDVAVTLTQTTGNAQTVVDLAYGLMGSSGCDIYEEGIQETTYMEEYDIAVKQVMYFEEDRTKVRIAVLYADYKQDGYYLSAAITYCPEQFDEDYPALLEELRDAYALNLPEIPPMDGV